MFLVVVIERIVKANRHTINYHVYKQRISLLVFFKKNKKGSKKQNKNIEIISFLSYNDKNSKSVNFPISVGINPTIK
jgi:hypothetical protein